ncbi:50S ribosomal protein L34e [Candidatus Bathyarchaeota archaeon]|nr:MAG: 50S ribosomal protein L34e [Candidatus Bathyarchaeota archaeon]
MPRPSLRTRSRKRIQKKVPGGKTVVHYKKEKSEPAKCSRCGRMLHGIPRCHPSELKKLTRSQRRIMRMYGGQLCASCLKELLKEAVRLAA